MKMKTSSVVLLIFAISLAGMTALVARALLSPASQKASVQVQDAPKPKPVFALVAAKKLLPGDFLDGASVEWSEVLPSENRAGLVLESDVSKRRQHESFLFGATVRAVVEEGAPLVGGVLLRPGEPGFIAAVLAPGMRAVSIPVSAVTSNAGLVSAGDWVDVILSVEKDEARDLASKGNNQSMHSFLAAQTILHQVRVLALNSSTEGISPALQAQEEQMAKKPGQPARRMVYETITLEVTPKDAEHLAVSREAGSLQVALRGVKERGVQMAQMPPASPTTRLRDTTAVFTGKTDKRVQTFHGSKVGAVNF